MRSSANPEPTRQATLSARTVAIVSIFAPCLLCVPRNQIPTLVVLFAAAAATLWVGQYDDIANRYLREHPWRRRILIGCSSLLFAFLAIGSTLSAKWSQMDDHELAKILGADHHLGLGEMVQQLATHEEVGELGSINRIRPMYYIVRYAEAYFWGENLMVWYAARLIALACVLMLCWTLLWHWLGTIDSGITLVLFACFRMWGDLWARIGASETYAMVGIAVAIIGLQLLERRQPSRNKASRRRLIGWLAILFGTIVAMGCKENFLILAPAVGAYAIYAAFQLRLGWMGALVTSLVLAFSGFLALKIISSLAATDGLDIYAKERSIGTLLASTAECMTMHFGAVLLLIIGFLGWTWRRCKRDDTLKTLCPNLKITIWAFVGLLLLFTSQFAFYDGFSAFGDRYAFPAALAPLLTIPLLTQLWHRYRTTSGASIHSLLADKQRMRFVMVAVVCIMGISMQRKSVRRVESSHAFTSDIEALAEQCHASPKEPVLFISNGTGDFEALYSVHTFLRYYQVTNPIFLKVEHDANLDQEEHLAQSLMGQLRRTSTRGDKAFEPIDRLASDADVLHVSFQNNRKYGADTVSFESYR